MSVYAIIGIVVLVVFLIIALSVATYSGAQFIETYDEINKEKCYSYITTQKFAQILSRQKFDGTIRVGRTKDYLGDCFICSQNAVLISEQNVDSTGIASLAVIAHEFGHAEQNLENPSMLQKMGKMRRMISFLGVLVMPCLIVGAIMCVIGGLFLIAGGIICGVGLFLFLLALWAKLKILPIEKNASQRGLAFLQEFDVLTDDELVLAKKVLDSAYLTYVGDFFRALLAWTFLTRKAEK